MLRDNSETIAHRVTVAPASIGTAPVSGSAVDLLGYDSATFVLSAATSTGSGTVTATLEDSATGTASWTARGTVTYLRATNGTATYITAEPYTGSQRYVRATLTPSGSGTAIMAATFALGDPKTAPVA